MTAPRLESILDRRDEAVAAHGLAYLRHFLERLVWTAAKEGGLVVGEAEPGRYLLVMPSLPEPVLRDAIDAGLDLVLARLGERWAEPHVTDFGLRELYKGTRDRWLARHGIEALVTESKVGVVTIFCHDWVYGVCQEISREKGLAVQTPFEEYLRAGKFRVEGTNAFQLDLFANVREMAANFYPIDHLHANLLVVAGLSEDAAVAARLLGRVCPSCAGLVEKDVDTCPSCGASLAT